MQTYHVKLESEIFKTFRCQMAANSLDIDTAKKNVHELKIETKNFDSPYNVGLILGASGSGKTTLAKKIFGDDCFSVNIDSKTPIIDQLPKELSYEECAEMLAGIGLTSVPCWIRPVYTLSNGQKARAEAVLAMTKQEPVIIDEWTSVVDRTVAKVMSHCVQKFARKNKKKIVLNSCHYDVVEWLNPDWIIDCNKQSYSDRRLLQPDERIRTEQLQFSIRNIDRSTWRYFSKYHYLSDMLPGGELFLFGLFHENNQIGFQCFANYVPTKRNDIPIFHSNRTVIHPDYAGFGLGIRLINETSKIMKEKNVRVMAKFSSIPIYRSMIKNKQWVLKEVNRTIGNDFPSGSMSRKTGFRSNVKTFSFEFVG